MPLQPVRSVRRSPDSVAWRPALSLGFGARDQDPASV